MIVKMVAAMLMAAVARARYLSPLGSSGSLSIDSFSRVPSFPSGSLTSSFGAASSPFSSRHSKRYSHLGPTTGKHRFKALTSVSGLNSGPLGLGTSYSYPKDLGFGSLHPLSASSTPSFTSIPSISSLGTYPFSSSLSSSPFSTSSSFDSSLSLVGLESPFSFDDASPLASSPFGSTSSTFEKLPQVSSVGSSVMTQQSPMLSSSSVSGSAATRTSTASSSLQQQVPSTQASSSDSFVSTSSSTIPHMTINFNMPSLAGSSSNSPTIGSSVSTTSNTAPAIAKQARLAADKPSVMSAPVSMLAAQHSSANASDELRQPGAPSTTMSISFSIPQFPNARPNASSPSVPVASPAVNANDLMINPPQMMMSSAVQQHQQQQQQQQQMMMMSAAASEPHPSFAADMSFGQADLVGSNFDGDNNYLSEFSQPSTSTLGMPVNSFYYPGFAAGAARPSFSPSTPSLLGLSFAAPSKSHVSYASFASPYGAF